MRSNGGPQQIASSAGRVKLPANTAIRRSRIFSRSVSRSWLHSRVARMVWCRVMPIGPCPSTDSASPSRCTISAGSSTAILRGGQLQGQRHAVEPSAQVDHALGVVGVERETRSDLRGAFHEQPHRGELLQRRQVGVGDQARAPAASTTAPGR